MNNFYIIDGNAYIYRSFYAIPKLNNTQGVPTNAVYGFLQIMLKILQEKMQDQDKICICFDAGRITFRNEMYEAYKAHRDKMPDDLVLQVPIIKEGIDKIGIKRFEKKGYEADDLIASLTKKAKENYNVKIISSDKDILQLLDDKVEILPIPKENKINVETFFEEFGFSPENMLDYLSILGDSSDNVPGVKGLGKKGQKLVVKYKTVENIIQNIEDLDTSVKTKILENIENLKISKELIKLDSDVEIDFAIEDCMFSKSKNLKENLEFKKFLEKSELFSIAKRIFEHSKNVSIEKNNFNDDLLSDLKVENISLNVNIPSNWTEKMVFQEKDLDGFIKKVADRERIYLTFSESFGIIYIYIEDDCLYKILFEDIFFYKQEIENIFGNMKLIVTDNAKCLYSFCKKNNFKNNGFQVFDLLFASYVLNMSVQKTDAMIRKYANEYALKIKDDVFFVLHSFASIYEIVLKELKKENVYEKFQKIDIPYCEALADMEKNGVKIDTQKLSKFNQDLDVITNKLVSGIYEEAGEVFNINSPKQLANILFNKLKLPVIKKIKTGYSTNEEVLVELAKKSNLPKKILDYREVVKLKNTYVEPILKLVDSNHRIYTTYNFTNTTTGRLSSMNPNLQNIPIKTELGANIRKAFIASDGYYLVSSDYSQIDLVVLAHLSGDKNISKAFINGVDIHKWTASLIFKKDTEEIDQRERNVAKQINFGLIYGKGAFALSQDLNISVKEAKNFIELYFDAFPELKNYFESSIKIARDVGFVKTIFNQKRYLPELNDRNKQIQKLGERLAMNTPVQGSSADILKKAMVDLLKEFGDKANSDGVKMLLQIHDEILFEVKAEIIEETIVKIKDIMEKTVKLDVPLRVNVNYGKNWAELK